VNRALRIEEDSTMTRRGTTLVEVLVAIFVTAIGLLALLALFPLGALSMAQAIKDSRTAHLAGNAAALAEAYGLRNDASLYTGGIDVFQNPTPTTGTPPPLPTAHPELPSYPIYVDPIGVQAYSGIPGASIWLAGNLFSVPRRSVSLADRFTSPPLTAVAVSTLRARETYRAFTLLDDMTFIKDPDPVTRAKFGDVTALPCAPDPTLTGTYDNGGVQRDGKYSFAVMLQRPRASNATFVNMTVVVYSGRPSSITTTGAGLLQPTGETMYTLLPTTGPAGSGASNNAGDTVITVAWTVGQEKPALRRGAWVLDASLELVAPSSTTTPPQNFPPALPPPPAPATYTNGWIHSNFYRVVGITDPSPLLPVLPAGVAGAIDIEVQTPLKDGLVTIQPNPPQSHPTLGASFRQIRVGRLIVLEKVVEVLEKGLGRSP
jgi:type II secretory pathway pseudopilin PulG